MNRAWLPLASLVLALACSGAGGDADATSTADAPGGSDTVLPAAAGCDKVCAALAKAHCFYAGGESDCAKSCAGYDAMSTAGALFCRKAWTDYTACVAAGPLADCGGVATWNVLACRPAWDHFVNYCQNGVLPTEACSTNAAWDAFCAAVPGKPKGTLCRGDVPADCAVGGNSNNADLYCCP